MVPVAGSLALASQLNFFICKGNLAAGREWVDQLVLIECSACHFGG